MNLQAFIFNWRGHEANAISLERKISPLAPVTVINSDEQARTRHPGWIHLGEDAYFSAQWNTTLSRFSGDVLFHIQADADLDDFGPLFAKARDCFSQLKLGVYEPNVDYTDLTYDTSKLPTLSPTLFEVPLTDCTCWFIHRAVLAQCEPVDLAANKYGWGVPGVVAAVSRLQGRRCARDYSITVRHPKGRGYSTQEALLHRRRYFASLSFDLQDALREVYGGWSKTKAASPARTFPIAN